MRVVVIDARNGPKGNAAGHRTDPSEYSQLAVTFALSGTCQAVSSNLSSGEPARDATLKLPARAKSIALPGESNEAFGKQKRASSVRCRQSGPYRSILVGLSLAGLSVGVLDVGSAERCHGEATMRVVVIDARNGPKGNAAGHR